MNFQTDGRGWGLKALEDIPKGALVQVSVDNDFVSCLKDSQEYIGEVVTKEDFNLRTSRNADEYDDDGDYGDN